MSGAAATAGGEPAFYAPRPTGDPLRFELEATDALCVGPPERQFLMGGVGLASAIAAMEAATGRPVVWATAQYLAYAQPDDRLDLRVEIPVSGRHVSQARAVTRVGEREILAVAGAFGGRQGPRTVQLARPPEAPAPEACEPNVWRFDGLPNLGSRFERRNVATREADGRAIKWVRTLEDDALDAGLVAIVADFFAGFLDTTHASMSLDNTIRIHHLPDDARAGWLLCDATFAGIHAGAFHGEMRIFDAGGALLATASQSAMLPRTPRPGAA